MAENTRKRPARRKPVAAKAPVVPAVPEQRVKAEVYVSKRPLGRQKFRFRITAFNNKRLAVSSEAYANKVDALVACRLVVGDQHIDDLT